jgi:hypothetical protein
MASRALKQGNHMKKRIYFLSLLLLAASCRKAELEPLADLSKLEGDWRSTDFPIAVTINFKKTEGAARITQVAGNAYAFRTNDVFWKDLVALDSKTFRIAQLNKSRTGYYVFQSGRLTILSDTELRLTLSGESDDAGLLPLHGKTALFRRP